MKRTRIEDEYSMIDLAKEIIERVLERIRELGGDRITFITLLYGSVAKNRDTPLSEFDIYIKAIKNFDDFTQHINLYYSYLGGVIIE